MVIGSDNLIFETTNTEGITLAAGTYTAGTIVIEGATEWSLASLDDTVRALVLLSDIETAVDGTAAIGAEGVFNLNKITKDDGALTAIQVAAVLQKKNIFLKTAIVE